MLQVNVVTLFPEMFDALSEWGISGRACRNKLLDLKCYNPRSYTEDRHQTVDDRPYGGGPGMVIMVEPLRRALQAIAADAGQREGGSEKAARARVINLSPQGQPLTQRKVLELAALPAMTLVCGRYEGIDQRFIDDEVDEQISLGDYVISGGELAAMVVIDAVIRQLPGALGDSESAEQESFVREGLLDYPHYTRPESLDGQQVPPVLLSGDHAAIEQWRLLQALRRTREQRPDLWQQLQLGEDEKKLLKASDEK